MDLAITHLTRMGGGYVCAAGIDLDTRRQIRPVLAEGPLPADVLEINGGPVALGAMVRFSVTHPRPTPPQVENHVFQLPCARSSGRLDEEAYWKLLLDASRTALEDLFGPELRPVPPASAAVELGRGSASLGTLLVVQKPSLGIVQRHGRPAIRVRLHEGCWDLDLGVTDLRLYGEDLVTPHAARVEELARRMARPGALILNLGLTRPYAPDPALAPRHWLQVNNIHLESHPLGVWKAAGPADS